MEDRDDGVEVFRRVEQKLDIDMLQVDFLIVLRKIGDGFFFEYGSHI
jgi:hypothetical protein